MSNLATIGWPSGADTGWPSEPRNMLPGRIEGYPQGSQRSANTAERLLSQAVGWWDAAAYRDDDRLLRNRGVAGELLDLQLGSSDRVATTNDPLFLAPEDQGYVYLPGVAANYLSSPASAAYDTEDFDLAFLVSYDVSPVTSSLGAVGVYDSTGTRVTLRVDTSTNVRLLWNDGTSRNVQSTTGLPAAAGQKIWVRATMDFNAGGTYEVKFYYSEDISTTTPVWTQLGDTRTGAQGAGARPTGKLFQAWPSTGAQPIAKFYRAILKDGIGGTTVLDIDCDAITDGSATSFQAVTGQTVTINRSTSGRKSVAVPRRNGGGRSLFLLGTDDYFECVGNWQHQLLNFDAQDSFTVLLVQRQFATVVNNSAAMRKGLLGQASYTMSESGPDEHGFVALDVVLTNVISRSAILYGTQMVEVGRLDRSAEALAYYRNGELIGSSSTKVLQSLWNNEPFRIARRSDGLHANLEFTSAAIFRRALTPDEITTITDYYQNRGY